MRRSLPIITRLSVSGGISISRATARTKFINPTSIKNTRWMSTLPEMEPSTGVNAAPQQSSQETISLSSFKKLHESISESLRKIKHRSDSNNEFSRLSELKKQVDNPNLWDNVENANKVNRQYAELDKKLSTITGLLDECSNNLELGLMAFEENNPELITECNNDLSEIHKTVDRLLLDTLLCEPTDQMDAFLEINAGSGGQEAFDFTSMLLKMYMEWAKNMNYECELQDSSPAENGIRSAMIRINGPNIYGWLKFEAGVHRLVRISKYDTASRRHTSFAKVTVMPCGDCDIDGNSFELDMKDVQIDTYRSSGPGGQHVNTTDSAVRATHLPTGLKAQCQTQRSQIQNKKVALAVLRSRVLEHELNKQAEAKLALKNVGGTISFGSQMRSYIMQPYQLVKDHRTNHETSQVDAIFSGEPEYLTPFMERQLEVLAGGEAKV